MKGNYSARVIGGVAAQEVEAWILALLGERRSEDHKDAKAVLRDRHGITSLAGKAAVVENAQLDRVPDDAVSLLTWLTRARSSLAPPA